ncbi:trypacidin cluster transcriptional coactivator tpcD [Aspergillus alliaceus]|uniref:trypacidin cluster transcriptional coactivator tpcD n=1 Tax=Petromyces alliaceus TaxID=209559 RepID=UPI0012A4CF23|nr:uncharacterized protein BDW43DRAFT_304014 [Aspergillus alliaceus]KAB8228297.1 hypothetical protein BDW43DRAFT_304014 [Aspergillus alliaceus]
MNNVVQLQHYSSDLATAITSLVGYSRSANIQQTSSHEPPLDSEEVQRAKAHILSIVSKIRTLICGPTRLPPISCKPGEILACLRWLREFQILACIPLIRSVPIKDIADLTGVPQTTLARIIRLTATAGFLHELQPSHVARTPLSASFSFESLPSERPYDLGLLTAKPFHATREQQPKLNRQWSAYLHHVGGLYTADDVADVLMQLSWSKISNISDPATAILYYQEPENSNSRITVTNCTLGNRQTASDAAVYILHLPPSSPGAVHTELAVHRDVLCARHGIMLLLTARLLPKPGSLPHPEVEAMARSRDLALLQLTNEGEMEMVALLGIIDLVRDSVGRLVVTKRLCASNGLVVSLVVKYKPGWPRE